jgi:hypothetical protein
MYIAAIQVRIWTYRQSMRNCAIYQCKDSEVSFAFPADTAMWEEEMEKSKQMKEEI